MKDNKKDLTFIIIFIAVCLIPLLFMPIFGNQPSVGNENEPKLPAIKTKDGKLNKDVASDAGNYFAKKFAFRQELINTGDLIKGKIFGVSAQNGVIIGKGGWLFYSNTLEDYQGISTLSDYRIASSSYNLSLVQKKLRDEKIKFAFTISPNKNSLYPEKMRSGYKISKEGRNSSRLIKQMKKDKINYIDLYHLFENRDEVLYHKTDSHWNNKGAAMVSTYLQDRMGHKATDWSDEKYVQKNDFQGDLAAMIYPLTDDNDKEIYYEKKFSFDYSDATKEFLDKPENDNKKITDQSVVETKNKGKKGSIMMLRDSFGISLIPFIAEDYEKGYFLNKSPYYFQPAIDRKFDVSIFELVERNLSYLTTDAPELDMGKVTIDKKKLKKDNDYTGTVKSEMSQSGNQFNKIYGDLEPEKTKNDTKLYIEMTSVDDGKEYITPAFRTTRYGAKDNELKQYGYSAYISWKSLQPGEYNVRLIYGNEGSGTKITQILGKVTLV